MLIPYYDPVNLNGNLASSAILGSSAPVYTDRLDKRNGGYLDSIMGPVREYSIVDTAADMVDSIANMLGYRAPLYTIGKIDEDAGKLSQYVNDSVKGIARAVSTIGTLWSSFGGTTKQEGIVIDGLGDVDGTSSVDFSTNPQVFMSDNIVDNRVRVPSTVRMVVMVSNYGADDIIDTTLNSISAWDPTGLLGSTVQVLANKGNTRAQEKLYQLRTLMETGMPFTVYTPHGIYENMLIKSLHAKSDAEKMDMLWCEIEFKEVILYQEYTTNPGKIPSRRGVDEISSGWTGAAKKVTDLFQKSTYTGLL